MPLPKNRTKHCSDQCQRKKGGKVGRPKKIVISCREGVL